MSEITCPRCGTSVPSLQVLDSGLIRKITEEGGEPPPPQVCLNCFTQLAGSVARGSVLLAHEKAKEQQKMMMWKSRVNFIKKGRILMKDKAYSDAAVQYEKYFRILEIVYEADSGGLTPEMFKDSARTNELTVVASSYWDLMRIYDTSEKYGERQRNAARKLAEFLRFTPLYPDIIRRAESLTRTAKNPEAFKQFLKMASEKKGKCFIATSAFDSEWHPVVVDLTLWRDLVLKQNSYGRSFIWLYYKVSPSLALMLDLIPFAKPSVRWILTAVSELIARRTNIFHSRRKQ